MRSEGPSLLPVFRSRHQADLLAWLLLHPDQEYGLSELAIRLGIPLTTLHREVDRLAVAGLIGTRLLGRNRLLRSAPDHPATPSLTRLLEVTFGPSVVIEDEFADLDADQVLIFGSWAARYAGEAGPPPRDIDVLVIGRAKRADVYAAADRTQEKIGLPVNPVIRTREQWDDADDRLVRQIKASPITLVIDHGGTSDGTLETRGS